MSSWRSRPTPTERLAVARILGAKGLAGRLKIEVLTDRPERLDIGVELFVEGEQRPRRVRRVERGGRVPAIELDGIDTREAAEALADRYLEAPAEPLPEGTYYWHQLEGLQVMDQGGREVGTLVEVFRTGGSEVYRIEGSDGEVLVPALRRFVLEIDLAEGRMTIAREAAEEVR